MVASEATIHNHCTWCSASYICVDAFCGSCCCWLKECIAVPDATFHTATTSKRPTIRPFPIFQLLKRTRDLLYGPDPPRNGRLPVRYHSDESAIKPQDPRRTLMPTKDTEFVLDLSVSRIFRHFGYSRLLNFQHDRFEFVANLSTSE